MRKHVHLVTAIIMAGLIGSEPLHAAHIRGKIVRVGFSGSGSASGESGIDFYRSGAWTPVLVELNNSDGDLFEGVLQVAQLDRDGDYATATVPVNVREMRNYYAYVPAGSSDIPFNARVSLPNGSHVPLYNDRDEPVHELRPANTPQALPENAEVVLDISTPPVNQLNGLVQDPKLVRELFIARIAATELPDQVPGIEWVDTIVWDNPDPSAMDLPQRDALIEWVHRGGTLILGVAKNWQSVSKSQFAPLLPATLTGTRSSSELRELGDVLLGFETTFDKPITYCPVTKETMTPDATVIIPLEPEPDSELFVLSRPYGRGRTILVTAEIKELLARGTITQNPIFLRNVLNLRTQEQEREIHMWLPDMFGYIETATGFKVTSRLYLLFACLFVVAYIGVASGGSWIWLKRRQRLYLAWPAFAIIAMIASGTSLAAVQIIRGIGLQVQQFSVVDAKAGSSDAAATCYFGLKTASHQLLDLTISGNSNAGQDVVPTAGGLAPMAANNESWQEETYSAGKPYEVIAPLGQLRSVPMRATLKQFRGAWHGELPGRLNANLQRPSSSYRLHPDSWIENQLSADLYDCYLFVALDNVREKGMQKYRGKTTGVYPISRLLAGQKISLKEVVDQQIAKQLKPGETAEDQKPWRPYFLDELQGQWLEAMNIRQDRVGGNEKPEITSTVMASALLLATTWSDLSFQTFNNAQYLKIGRALELDRSAALTKRTALFVGFTESDAGPARLCWREAGTFSGGWRAINPSESRVMYRFSIPVTTTE